MAVTFHCNAGSYDIRALKPYAAYDLLADAWVVHPPELPADWGWKYLPPETWRRFDQIAFEAQSVLALPEPARHAAVVELFDMLHDWRHQAYGPYGQGWLDTGNVIWQALSQHPDRLLQRLYAEKHATDEPLVAEGGPASGRIPKAMRRMIPRSMWRLPRRVVLDRPAQRDLEDVPPEIGKKAMEVLDALEDGKVTVDSKERDLEGAFTVRITNSWRAALYVGIDLLWHVFAISNHYYEEIARRFSSIEAGVNGVLPTGLTFAVSEEDEKARVRALLADEYGREREVGYLSWYRADGEIASVMVDRTLRRRGIATELLRRARQVDPKVHHSDVLSQSGTAWSQKAASYVPWQAPANISVQTGGDSNYGQWDGWVAFFDKASGEKIGYIDYSVYQGEFNIKMVSVDPKYRRQGYATLLLQAALHDSPDATVNPGYTTESGGAWWNSIKQRRIAAKDFAFGEMPDPFGLLGRPIIGKEWNDRELVNFFLDYKGKQVGVAQVYAPTEDDPKAVLAWINVNEEARRKGVASTFLRYLKSRYPGGVRAESYTDLGEKALKPILGAKTATPDSLEDMIPALEKMLDTQQSVNVYRRTRDLIADGKMGRTFPNRLAAWGYLREVVPVEIPGFDPEWIEVMGAYATATAMVGWSPEDSKAIFFLRDDAMNEVVLLHEVAHLVLQYRGESDNHGPRFQRVCADLYRKHLGFGLFEAAKPILGAKTAMPFEVNGPKRNQAKLTEADLEVLRAYTGQMERKGHLFTPWRAHGYGGADAQCVNCETWFTAGKFRGETLSVSPNGWRSLGEYEGECIPKPMVVYRGWGLPPEQVQGKSAEQVVAALENGRIDVWTRKQRGGLGKSWTIDKRIAVEYAVGRNVGHGEDAVGVVVTANFRKIWQRKNYKPAPFVVLEGFEHEAEVYFDSKEVIEVQQVEVYTGDAQWRVLRQQGPIRTFASSVETSRVSSIVGSLEHVSASTATMWHVTDNPHFALDPEHQPAGGPDIASNFRHSAGLFVTPNPELWHYLWRPMGRVYAAEIDVSRANAKRLGITTGDDRDQWFVAADDLDKAVVKRVVPIDVAEKEAKQRGYGFAIIASDLIAQGGPLHVINHGKGFGTQEAYCGGYADTSDPLMMWTTVAWVREHSPRICPDCLKSMNRRYRTAHAAQPEVTFVHSFDKISIPHRITAFVDGREVGFLDWLDKDHPNGHGGTISHVEVDPAYRRMGIATKMLARAREIQPGVHHSTNLTPDGRAWAQTVAKTSAVVEQNASPLPYDRYSVNKRILITEGSGYHPDADLEAAKAKQEAAYQRWRAANPRRPRPDRFKPENAGSWTGGMKYYLPGDVPPGTVAFIDLQVQGTIVKIAYMHVREDQRRRGLARQLLEEVYRRYPKATIEWGKMMEPEVGTLYKSFQQSHPDQTGHGSVYY